MLIKLTGHTSGQPTYVHSDHIVAITYYTAGGRDGSTIHTINGNHVVRERPSEAYTLIKEGR